MAENQEQPEEKKPNVPVVPVANLSDSEIWLMYERYKITFSPPSITEYKLCSVIAALEQLVEDLGSGIKRDR